MLLHKITCNTPFSNRNQYLAPINQAFGEKFENLSHFKREDNFRRCLSKLSLEDVLEAVRRADDISRMNGSDAQKKLIKFKGYSYYRDNPSLSVHESVKSILLACGII